MLGLYLWADLIAMGSKGLQKALPLAHAMCTTILFAASGLLLLLAGTCTGRQVDMMQVDMMP